MRRRPSMPPRGESPQPEASGAPRHGPPLGRESGPWPARLLVGGLAIAVMVVVFSQARARRRHVASQLDASETALRTDELTGLRNRRGLHEDLDTRLARLEARSHTGPVATIFLDIDGFKQVNDLFGHETGDLVLKEIGHRIAETVRPGDTAGRLAGDEFIVICPDIESRSSAAVLANRIARRVERPIQVEHDVLQVGVSFGIAFTKPGAGDSPEEVIRVADAAMYEHKRCRDGRAARPSL